MTAPSAVLDKPIDTLQGVGPSLRGKLEKLGITSTTELLLHLPRRYQDRSRLVPLREVRAEQECLVEGTIVEARLAYGRRRSLLVTIEDTTGYLGLRFFHFAKRQQAALRPGVRLRCFGQARFGREGLEMAHPEYHVCSTSEPAPAPGLTPVYSTTKGLGQGRLRSLVAQLFPAQDRDADYANDSGPYAAFRYLHQPPPAATLEDIEATQARIARDELTAYYLVMRQRQALRNRESTLALPSKAGLGRRLLEHLGFELTGAQRRVLREVLEDLEKPAPMLRLLQGDVGSGKTVVAAFAAIRASEHGAQSALMAPTEILAEQHFINLRQWLEPLGISVVLVTGSQAAAERRATLEAIASGTADVAVGTHALFQTQVEFATLALTIVDEQHRFGVHQRMALRAKGRVPHQLVMTATPIPRTLTMALYADMDVSLLDELPAGRQPIDTAIVSDQRRDEIVARVAARLAAGEQAYWVCPLIEDSDTLPVASVTSTVAALGELLPQTRIGELHGRMPSQQKAAVMAEFKRGAIGLLVATTVVEVGVDVPNATLMVIENPERLGLSQLHQLRGRVGRGSRKSRCVLLYGNPLTEAGKARLKVIRDSQDGFHIAEQDLKLRGPGDLLGARQTGEQQFRVADLNLHAHLIPDVVAQGDALLRDDPAGVAALLEVWAPRERGPIAV